MLAAALVLGLQLGANATPGERPVVRILASKDFSHELPANFRTEETRRSTLPLSITEKVRVEVLVHYDSLVDQPDFFRKIEVEVADCPRDVEVGATIGNAINLGTAEAPRMAVPILVQWRGVGWLRMEKWTLFGDGKLLKDGP